MLDSEQNFNSLNNGLRKQYSRKQLTQWICKQADLQSKTVFANSCNINSLKNGVFFLLILQKIYPNESASIKSKMKEKPVTEYDFQKNLQLVKKVLNGHKLQFNLDIHQIIKSKNCLNFLGWIKNLSDGLISTADQDQQKPQTCQVTSPEKQYNLNSGYKTNRDSSPTKSGQKTLSQAKSNRNYSTSKSDHPFYKVASGKNLVQVNNKELPVLSNNRSHVVTQKHLGSDLMHKITVGKAKGSGYMSQFDSLDDCNEALYQIALDQSIGSFRQILRRVKNQALDTQNCLSLQQYLARIEGAIFMRN